MIVKATPKPEESMEITLEIRMTLEEMRELEKVIEDKWPGWAFSQALQKVMRELEKSHSEEIQA